MLLSFKNDGTCSIQCNVKPSGESSWGEFVFLTEDGCMLAGWDSRAHSVSRGLVAMPMPVTCHCRGPAPSLPVSSEQQARNTMQRAAQPPGPVECCYLHIPVVGSFFCSQNCVCFVIIGLFPMFQASSIYVSARQREPMLGTSLRRFILPQSRNVWHL